MTRLNINLDRSPAELQTGLREIITQYPDRFGPGDDARGLAFQHNPDLAQGGLAVKKDGPSVRVQYGRVTDAFRALGRLLGETEKTAAHDFSETPRLDMVGIMIDISRNGVITPDAARAVMRRAALMGINVIMLYAEDTYELSGQPFFGYLRGRYTHDEMKELDDYAGALGIEMFPCIQTLGHLEQILQWPAYADRKDTNNVVIAEEEETYALIEKMIAAAAAPFRSKRIHLGMDEAHGIGSGEYKKRHGEKRPFDILNAHLAKVLKICEKHGLEPMIWSDMYFRLGSETDDYYDPDIVIPPDVVAEIPKTVQLVYWDYYHTDQNFYENWIARHRALGSEPVMAGGIWTWSQFWAALPFSFTTIDRCMAACKKTNLRQAFMTMWGDDGMECDIFSALPGMQRFAEHAYADTIDPDLLRANFTGSCNANLDDWLRAADLNAIPGFHDPRESPLNVAKWLLWQDTLLGLMEPQFEAASPRKHYDRLSRDLFAAAERTPQSRRLQFPARIARVLSLKCELRRDLVAAYRAKDKTRLTQIMDGDLTALRAAVDELWKCHRDMWLQTYKPFGLEVIEQRYGALRTRLESLADRLDCYLDAKVAAIPELDTTLERILDRNDNWGQNYARIYTPTCIK